MSRRSTSESLMLREFAGLCGCSIQWARRLKKQGDRKWLDFIADHTVTGEPGPRIATDAEIEDAETELERARMSRQMTWDSYVRADGLAKKAFLRPDANELLPGLQRAAAEARKAYEAASDHCFKVELAEQKYIPVAQVREMKSIIPQLAECIQAMRSNISGRLPDKVRAEFQAAFDKEVLTWNKGVGKLEEFLKGLAPNV